MIVHKSSEDIERREVDGGWFQYLEYPNGIYVDHFEATEKGAGNRVLRQIMDFARSRGKDIYGAVVSHGDMDDERLLEWYKRRMGAKVIGQLSGHNVIKASMR